MKIYTKGGDKGQTSLIGGTRVPKHHIRIDAYGTIDELNSFVGLVRDVATDEQVRQELFIIQNKLFNIGSMLASDPDASRMKLPGIVPEDHEMMEKAIDRMNKILPELRAFILPGGHPHVSYCHLARTVCRRAERNVTALNEQQQVNDYIIIFLNRLSDYLFVLARKFSHDLGVEEIKWGHE